MLRRLQHVPVPGDVGGDVLLLAIGHAVVEARKVNDRVVPRDGSSIEDVDFVEGDILAGWRDVEHGDVASRKEGIDHEAAEAPAAAGDEYFLETHASPQSTRRPGERGDDTA